MDEVLAAADRVAALRALSDEDVVAALAALGTLPEPDPYLANILASEAMNRFRRRAGVLETTQEGVCALDRAGVVTYVNPAAERLLGWTLHEITGRDAAELARADAGTAEAFGARMTLETGEATKSEDARFPRKHGDPLPVAFTASPMIEGGEVEGAIVVFRDITDRKRLERRREVRRLIAEQLATATTIEDAGVVIVRSLAGAFGFDAGALWIPEPGSLELRCASYWSGASKFSAFEGATRVASFAPGMGLPGVVWQADEPFLAADFGSLDVGRFPRVHIAASEGLQAVVAFPCRAEHHAVAVVELYARRTAAPRETIMDEVEEFSALIGQFLERVMAVERLRASEAMKRGILASALDAIVTIDAEGRVLEFNPAAEALFGFRAEEAVGRDLYGLIVPPRFREAHRRGMARYLATGEARVLGRLIELPAVDKAGNEFPTELYIVRVPKEGAPVFTSHMRDIRERKRAEAARLEAEARYRDLFEATPVATLVADLRRGILDANPAFTSLTGYARDEIVGRTSEILHEDHVQWEAVGARLAEGAPFVCAMEIRAKDASTIRVEARFSPIHDREGAPTGFISALRPL